MKFAKNIVIGLVVISAFAAVMSSLVIWNQPVTPNCVA